MLTTTVRGLKENLKFLIKGNLENYNLFHHHQIINMTFILNAICIFIKLTTILFFLIQKVIKVIQLDFFKGE